MRFLKKIYIKNALSLNFFNFGCILRHEKRGETVSGFERIDTTANRIKEAMKLAGMRQADVVRVTGIDKGALSHYLKGRYEPKQDVIYKLAEALNVSEMWLWGYDCEMERNVVQQEIEKNPVEMAERHFEMIMDEDLNEIFDDLRQLDAIERKMVKDLAHSLAERKKTEA